MGILPRVVAPQRVQVGPQKLQAEVGIHRLHELELGKLATWGGPRDRSPERTVGSAGVSHQGVGGTSAEGANSCAEDWDAEGKGVTDLTITVSVP